MSNPEFRTRVSSELFEAINQFIEHQGIDRNTFLTMAIQAVKTVQQGQAVDSLEFSDEDQALINQAVENSGLSYNTLLKRGLLAEAKKQNSQAKSKESFAEMSDEALKNTTVKGAAGFRIKKAIDTIIDHNNGCELEQDKFFISPTLVFKLTGSNRGAINEYFKANKDMIDEHNLSQGLSESTNRKGKNADDPKEVLGLA